MFPINKPVELHAGDIDYCSLNLTGKVVLPMYAHPGAFGFARKNHVHEGIDLYCDDGDLVHCIEDGVIVGIFDFTGTKAGSPWWNDTQCIMVEGSRGVINYGEITVNPSLSVGDRISEGAALGCVREVLKVNKGRPMSMLHLELYKHGTTEPIKEWSLGQARPSGLLNPLTMLVNEMLKGSGPFEKRSAA